MSKGSDEADIPFMLRFAQLDKKCGGALKRDFGNYFELFWKKWGSMTKKQAKRDSHVFRRDLMKIAPSALIPSIVAAFRILGTNVEPFIGLVTSGFGPLVSLTIAQNDRRFLESLAQEESWVNKHRTILELVMGLYVSKPSPSYSEKDKYWKEWEMLSFDSGKGR